MTPGRRVVIHGGFHKTGTTSAQRFLQENGENVWPASALVLPWRLRDGASRRAVRYSRFGGQDVLDALQDDLATVLSGLDLGRKRTLLISDENLCGRMPGRDGQAGYDAAPQLMASVARAVHQVIPAADIRFVFTTREPEAWLRSTWLHNLRTSRLVFSYEDYARLYAAAADLDAAVAAVTAAVAPLTVSAFRLEELASHPFGPATPLVDLLLLPDHLRQRLKPIAAANRAPDAGLADAFLAINRSALDDAAASAARTALVAASEGGPA